VNPDISNSSADGPVRVSPRSEPTVPTPRRQRFGRVVVAALVGLLLATSLSACTPEEYRAWLQGKGVDTRQMSQQQLEAGAAMATAYWSQVIADITDLHKYDHVLSDPQLARLRACESGGNYAALSPGGAYRGAYQFATSTWRSVAGRHFPKWKDYDPAAAPGLVQDAMARALYLEQGRRPWPICGLRI